MHETATALVVAGMVALQVVSPLQRLGTVGQKLTEADVDVIVGLVSTSGRKPWVLVGYQAFVPEPGTWHVEAYLAPEISTPVLRRGRIQVAVSQGSASEPGRKPWHLERSASWAQVATPGRDFEEILGDRDVNRPFVVGGELTDEEIVTAITFIRTSPTNPVPPSMLPARTDPASIFIDVKGNWPVNRVVRTREGTVRIDLFESDHSGQAVTLERRDGKWKIIRVGPWIAG